MKQKGPSGSEASSKHTGSPSRQATIRTYLSWSLPKTRYGWQDCFFLQVVMPLRVVKVDISSKRSTGARWYKDLQNEAGGGGTGEEGGTGDDDKVEVELEKPVGELVWSSRIGKLKRRRKEKLQKVESGPTRQNQRSPGNRDSKHEQQK